MLTDVLRTQVYKGDLRGKEVAIKKLNIQEFDDETLDNFKKEVEILSKLRHPNVVLFMGKKCYLACRGILF